MNFFNPSKRNLMWKQGFEGGSLRFPFSVYRFEASHQDYISKAEGIGVYMTFVSSDMRCTKSLYSNLSCSQTKSNERRNVSHFQRDL
jgi:hypothetical protein